MSFGIEFLPIVFPMVIGVFFNLLAGIVVLKHNPNARVNRICTVMEFTVVVWILGDVILFQATNEATAMIGVYVLWAGACLIPSMLLQFVFAFTHTLSLSKQRFLYLPHLIGAVLYTQIVKEGLVVDPSGWFNYNVQHHAAFDFYSIYVMTSIVIGAIIMIRTYIGSRTVMQKVQMRYLLIGLFIAMIFSPMFDIIFPLLEVNAPTIGNLFGGIMGVFFAYSVIKYKVFDIVAVTETLTTPQSEGTPRLEPGVSYLIDESGTRNSYEIFRGMVSTIPGLCITSFYPPKARERYKLQKTPIIWLTDTETEEVTIKADRLDFELSYTIDRFLKENERTVVLIDDVKYLAQINGFEKTTTFLKGLTDLASMHDSTLILSYNKELFNEMEFVMLEGMFDQTISMSTTHPESEGAELLERYSYLVKETRASQTYSMIAKLQKERPVLYLTKTFPDKLRKSHGLEGGTYYWLTDAATGENILSPSRLQFEVEQATVEFMRQGKHGIVVIDAIDQLAVETGLDLISDFLKVVIDIAAINDSTVLVQVPPGRFDPIDMAVLERRFDSVIEGK